ncbi:MAG: DegV family protein [Ruminococcaceae bacterium]|nr:DegV family protein [Oscillospiraceae bacterium]
MNEFVLFTDSCCDLSAETLLDWNVKCLDLTFRFDDSDREYQDKELGSKVFYQMMRDGKSAKTSAINIAQFKEAFEAEVKNGNDILYLGFSSGLSTTYNSARVAAEELSEAYPERKIIVVDSLCASAGQALLLSLAIEKKSEGATIEETAKFVEDHCLSICHWFTVDDLEYLKRGGRVSPAVAFVGGLLGIKPVLHVDDEGHLISVSKSRGRKAAITALADRYSELALHPESGKVFISQADCMDDAKELERILVERHKIDPAHIVDIGPVIGSHSGPGTLALFFVGKKR